MDEDSAARPKMQALAIGKDTLLRGEYRLLEPMGGGESRVYLARRELAGAIDSGSTPVVARLWKPGPELLREHGAQAMFERAADQMRAAALLRHPVLAMVETSGALDDGTLFIVTEHADGQPLDVFINSAGLPPLPSVIDLAYRICSGLNTAHRNGLAHAALHPGSVIVKPQGEAGAIARLGAKLIDFGTPTCMFGAPPSMDAARFMAPEQLELALKPAIERGEPTVRMNVYGCGALLYFMCTGGPPLTGQNIDELLVAHAAHKLVPPSRINPQIIPALDSIILKALEPEPRARFANAAELANALISIRFERSASGVRPRVEASTAATVPERADPTPRDRRITLDASDEAAMRSAGLAERPTSVLSKPPEGDDFVGFPSERPTAEVQPQLPTIPPLPRLSPPPPSLPPASVPPPSRPPPLPSLPAPARNLATEPPAVLARPARRSMVPAGDWLSRIPPVAFIALAALISLSVIIAVIRQPPADPAIEVTPLPAPRTEPPAAATPEPEPPAVPRAGATASKELRQDEEPEKPEPRAIRPRRAAPRASAQEPRALREPEQPRESSKPPEPPPAPEPEPTAEPTAGPSREKLEQLAAPKPERDVEPAPEPSVEPEPSAPKRSAIAPLPEKPPPPIVPLPEKAAPRAYDVEAKGSLATSQVRRGIERLQAATTACYRAALAARPASLGEVSMEVQIGELGRARGARASGAVPAGLKSCLEGAARKLTVPPPDTGTVTATWKISL